MTGASTGVGRGVALRMAVAGATVVAADLVENAPSGNFDDQPEMTTAELIRHRDGQAMFVACDVTRPADVAGLFVAAEHAYGRLDILVNNAGVYRGGRRIHEMTEEDLNACWEVIVKGSWFAAQEAVKVFLRQGGGGSIINIVSTAGLQGHVNQSVYNMAKSAQAALTRCLALEYAADNIRSNAICPTYLKTAMSRTGFESPEFEAVVARAVPLGRWGEIGDVAALAAFLAADDAAFLNGALIPVDGGETTGSHLG